jgi:hypothetical protein
VYFSFTLPVVTKTGRRFPTAFIEVSGTRSKLSVQIYTDASRRVALRLATLLRIDVRNVDVDSDPTAAVDFLLNAVLDELANHRVRATRKKAPRWPTIKFGRPKVGRWVGWTSRARRIGNAHAAAFLAGSA